MVVIMKDLAQKNITFSAHVSALTTHRKKSVPTKCHVWP